MPSRGDAPPLDRATTAGVRVEKRSGIVWGVIVVALVLRGSLAVVFSSAVIENWSTIFISLTLQALPFLVLGSKRPEGSTSPRPDNATTAVR